MKRESYGNYQPKEPIEKIKEKLDYKKIGTKDLGFTIAKRSVFEEVNFHTNFPVVRNHDSQRKLIVQETKERIGFWIINCRLRKIPILRSGQENVKP